MLHAIIAHETTALFTAATENFKSASTLLLEVWNVFLSLGLQRRRHVGQLTRKVHRR